jgi:hypothetical protein
MQHANQAPITGSKRQAAIMFIHIFGFKWKPATTQAQKDRAMADILAFRGKIPGLLEVHCGNNDSPKSQGYTFAGMTKFTDKAAFHAYVEHPQHQALLSWLVPLIDPVELDFEG